jgi:hypothetical protein
MKITIYGWSTRTAGNALVIRLVRLLVVRR